MENNKTRIFNNKSNKNTSFCPNIRLQSASEAILIHRTRSVIWKVNFQKYGGQFTLPTALKFIWIKCDFRIVSIEVSYFLVFVIDILLKNRYLWVCKSLEISDFTRTGRRAEFAKAKWANGI